MRAHELPYSPRLSNMPARDTGEWKSSLDDLVAPGDLCGDLPVGGIRAARLAGGGVIAKVQIGLSEVRHEHAHLRSLSSDDIIVLITLGGSGVITQNRRTFAFTPGDITFRRANVPSTARNDAPANLVMLRLPITRFLGHAPSRFDAFAPGCARASSGIVRAIHQFIESVLPTLAFQNMDVVTAAEQSLVLLLAAAYFEAIAMEDRPPSKVHPQAQRWSALQAFLLSNLSDPNMNVEKCAQALGISKRYVHKTFEANGLRYANFVLEQRLTRCKEALSNPRNGAVPIEQIAFRNGFNEPAHFSRSFRALFGMSPTCWRAQSSSAL